MWKRPDHQGAREVWGLWHSAGEEIHQDCRIDCWSPSPDFLIETCPCKGFAPLPCLIFPEKKKSTILFLANTHFWSVLGKQPHVFSHGLLVGKPNISGGKSWKASTFCTLRRSCTAMWKAQLYPGARHWLVLQWWVSMPKKWKIKFVLNLLEDSHPEN